MRKVFEPDSLELADLGGDTHFVTSIQRRVEEMMTARGAESQKIQQEILALGPRALPGVLNAAYVFTRQLVKSKQAQLLSDLLAGLVGQNLAAREILVKAGILEAPFIATRKTALRALQQLGEIHKEEMEQIRLRAWNSADKGKDYRSALLLYEFLVQQEDQQACSEVRYLAKDLFKEHVDIGPHFLDLALRCAHQDTYEILIEVMGEMGRTAAEFGREMRGMSPESVANLPDVLRAANEIKEKTAGYAHKGIENLFTGPIKKYLSNNPEVIEETGNLVRKDYKSLSRFLWQCFGRILKLDTVQQYFINQMAPPLDEFTLEGAVQLFYVQEKNVKFALWATELLEKLEENAPDSYQDAVYEFGKRFGKKVEDIIRMQNSKRSRLVKGNPK